MFHLFGATIPCVKFIQYCRINLRLTAGEDGAEIIL